MTNLLEPLIFEKSVPGHRAATVPASGVPDRPLSELLPAGTLRERPPALPELSELEVMRHYVRLSQLNYAIDLGFYPLGSCTMKYNPKVNEQVARLDGFAQLHPYQDASQVQGAFALMHELERMLCAITGLDRVSLQPAAGAHGEMTGVLMIRAYHERHGDNPRTKILVPDSAHGTNPATAALAGYTVETVKSNARGLVDVEDLRAHLSDEVAALMLTNPNTLGLFEEDIVAIAEAVHAVGALLYYDGANLNAIMGTVRPGDMGFDVVHMNLHKTFTTPHGGGGPGAGPVAVASKLVPFLPRPTIEHGADGYYLDDDRPDSIGRVKAFLGNFGMHVRAYAYIRAMGATGLTQVSQDAVLNANYLRACLKDVYHAPHVQPCMHEFVLSADWQKKQHGVNAMAIAKRLIDHGFHPPTVYFPLVVHEAMMIEPTETEGKATLDAFVAAMRTIADEARTDPETLRGAPHTAPIGRVDEVLAARKHDFRWKP